MEFHAERRFYDRTIALFLGERIDGQITAIAEPVTLRPHEPGSLNSEPFLSLTPEDAQRLADELWTAGLRPTQGRQSEGVTAAQEKHLNDMRAITFAKLNVPPPPEQER